MMHTVKIQKEEMLSIKKKLESTKMAWKDPLVKKMKKLVVKRHYVKWKKYFFRREGMEIKSKSALRKNEKVLEVKEKLLLVKKRHLKGTVAWDFPPPFIFIKSTHLGPWFLS
jgi:hypothetical protein